MSHEKRGCQHISWDVFDFCKSSSEFGDQVIWFLNAFWNEGVKKDSEVVWGYFQKVCNPNSSQFFYLFPRSSSSKTFFQKRWERI